MFNKIYLLLFLFSFSTLAQSDTLQVRFLYGSKPKPEHKKNQKYWFGGMLGGHVGIQYDETSYLSFFYEGRVHIFQRRKKKSGKYALQKAEEFNYIMDKDVDSVKTLIIKIPITLEQRVKFDSITNAYLNQCPYDYAFFGYRCGSSTYEILAQLGILKKHKINKTWRKIFYPKIVRRKLIHEAKQNDWPRIKIKGTHKRRWERD